MTIKKESLPMMAKGDLTERLTICVEPELKDIYDELTAKKIGLSELVRRFLREKLPQIRDEIKEISSPAGKG